MTVIVGVEHEGNVYLGGDSAAVSGWTLQRAADPKVFRHANGFLLGYAGSFRLGQLLRSAFRPPPPAVGEGADAYLAGPFMEALRAMAKEYGYKAATESPTGDRHSSDRWSLLLAFDQRLYGVHSDLQVTRMAEGYGAIGSGDDIALGALAVTSGVNPRARIRRVLAAVDRHNIGVEPPFVIVSGKGTWRGSRRVATPSPPPD
jgi:ATP-dependent protease HslVU (ClpYQ) peptidase subunit